MGTNKGMVNMNLFTDIFEKTKARQVVEDLYREGFITLEPEKVYWYSKYERKAYEYTTRSLKFFSRVWSRVTLRKWILFIPIYGIIMYIMSLILDTDMIGFFKHLLGMV